MNTQRSLDTGFLEPSRQCWELLADRMPAIMQTSWGTFRPAAFGETLSALNIPFTFASHVAVSQVAKLKGWSVATGTPLIAPLTLNIGNDHGLSAVDAVRAIKASSNRPMQDAIQEWRPGERPSITAVS